MKVASKLIFLFKDSHGFSMAISDALQPNPNNSTLRTLEETFELSLERYGIKDCKASGEIIHFVDGDGDYKVTTLLLDNYEPPILVCAVNEVLASITGENPSTMPTVILPCIVAASKLKWEGKNTTRSNKASLYGMQIGSETDIAQTVVNKTQKPPSSLQIHYEPLACFIQLARVLRLPTCILLGQSDQFLSHNTSGEELENIYEMGELLASLSSLCFLREKITWSPTKTTKDDKEPWRALYG